MGGSTGTYWRGTRVSTDMVAPLDELARLAGDDIYVKPIAGFGSYSDNANSADIDSGGGHLDLNLVGLSNEQKLRLERIARMVGFYADIREPKWYSAIRNKWLSANWQSHLHLVKKDTADRSDAATKQLNLWYSGFNGLAGFTWDGIWQYDPDDGPRQYLRQTWSQYKEIAMSFDETTEVILSGSVATYMQKPEGTRWQVGGLWKYASAGFFVLVNKVVPTLASQSKAIGEMRGIINAHGEMLKQIATNPDTPIDMAAVVEAARQGALEGTAAAIGGIDVVIKAEPTA